MDQLRFVGHLDAQSELVVQLVSETRCISFICLDEARWRLLYINAVNGNILLQQDIVQGHDGNGQCVLGLCIIKSLSLLISSRHPKKNRAGGGCASRILTAADEHIH